MKIFVGNLSSQTSEDDLRQAFEGFGEVKSVTIVVDAGEGKSRRFAFVTMPSVREAQNAIKKMHGKDFGGEKIIVEKSRTNTKARASRRKRSGATARGRAAGSRRGNSRPIARRRSRRR